MVLWPTSMISKGSGLILLPQLQESGEECKTGLCNKRHAEESVGRLVGVQNHVIFGLVAMHSSQYCWYIAIFYSGLKLTPCAAAVPASNQQGGLSTHNFFQPYSHLLHLQQICMASSNHLRTGDGYCRAKWDTFWIKCWWKCLRVCHAVRECLCAHAVTVLDCWPLHDVWQILRSASVPMLSTN